MGVLKHTSLHGRFTVHRSIFLSPSTTSSGFNFSLVIHSNTILFILWLETISPDPLSLWETLGAEPQEMGKWAAGTTHKLSKRKSKGQNRSSLYISKKDDSGDYSDSSSSLSCRRWPERLQVPLSAVVHHHCHPTSQGEQTETLIVLAVPNLTGKAALTFLVSPG